MIKINGIHHISAIVGDVNEAIHFYEKVLNLRLIKQTVNYDDKNTYHIYFSNEKVDNGFIFTFFSWDNKNKGIQGSGQVGAIAFSVAKGKLDYWKNRLNNLGIQYKEGKIFGKNSIDFIDSHTTRLSIVESNVESDSNDLLAFYGVELLSHLPSDTQSFLVNQLSFEKQDETPTHYVVKTENHYLFIPKIAYPKGKWGVGTVHHVAFSLDDEKSLLQLRSHLSQNKNYLTPVKDRNYFKAVYLFEVGSVVLEFSTKGPGFDIDENFDGLGSRLIIPKHFENNQDAIIAQLTPIER